MARRNSKDRSLDKGKEAMLSFLRGLADWQKTNGVTGLPALLVSKGTWFTQLAPLDVAWKKKNRPQEKECFFTGQLYCMDTSTPYFEGYALCQVPIHHGWNIVDGKVLDFLVQADLYLGVEIPREEVAKQMATGFSEPIADKLFGRKLA